MKIVAHAGIIWLAFMLGLSAKPLLSGLAQEIAQQHAKQVEQDRIARETAEQAIAEIRAENERWEGRVLLHICKGGGRVFRLRDGSFWATGDFQKVQVETPDDVCN